MSCENSAGRSGPQTPPEPGELKLSAGGIWCLTKIQPPPKKSVIKSKWKMFWLVVLSREHLRLTLYLITFRGNERGLTLVTGSSCVHSFDVKQVVLAGLQENLLLVAFDARDGPGIHQWESEWVEKPFTCLKLRLINGKVGELKASEGNINMEYIIACRSLVDRAYHIALTFSFGTNKHAHTKSFFLNDKINETF